MSFSFGAAGTKEETLESLRKNEHNVSPDGKAVLDLVIKVVEEATEGNEHYATRFTVNAAGHTGSGSVPTLSVQLQAQYVARFVE